MSQKGQAADCASNIGDGLIHLCHCRVCLAIFPHWDQLIMMVCCAVPERKSGRVWQRLERVGHCQSDRSCSPS